MAKELPFFKFEISEWMFGRIQKQSNELQGIFINLCCKYWHKLGEYTHEDARLDFGEPNIDDLIKSKIIGSDGDYVFIKFLDRQLDECAETSKKNSIKGLKSAQIRAFRKQQLTTVEPQLTTVQPNPTEEKRREDKREYAKGDIKFLPLFIAVAYKKKYNRDSGGEVGHDIDYISQRILSDMSKTEAMDQIRAHKLYTAMQSLTLPSKPETIQAALLETDWVQRMKEKQDNEQTQSQITNEHARNKHRNGSGVETIAPAYNGRIDTE
jgi:hypothetical protein